MKHVLRFVLPALLIICAPRAFAATELTGRVNTSGLPLAGAEVRLFYCHCLSGYGSRWLAQTKSDEQGNFRITRPDFEAPAMLLRTPVVMRLYLVAIHPTCAVGVTEVIAGQADGYTIALDPGRTISCTVKDETGAPVQGAEVTMQVSQGYFGAGAQNERTSREGLSALTEELFRSKTDKDGLVALSNVPHAPVMLRATDNRKGAGVTAVSQAINEVSLVVRGKTVSLRGTVSFAAEDGKPERPAPGMLVAVVVRRERVESWTLTDAQGRFGLSLARLEQNDMPVARLLVSDPRETPSAAITLAKLPEDEKEQNNIRIAMKPGKLLTVNLTNPINGAAVAGAVVAALLVEGGDAAVEAYRSSGRDGKCVFRAEGDLTGVWGVAPPPGYVMISSGRNERIIERPAGGDNAALEMEVVPEAVMNLTINDPEGKPSPNAQVFASQAIMRAPIVRTDAQGKARLTGLAGGKEMTIYALSQDMKMAASLTLPALPVGAGKPVEVKLRQARTAEFVMRDIEGNNLTGFVSVMLGGNDGRPGQLIGQARATQGAERGARLPGLLPDVDYVVMPMATGYRLAQVAQEAAGAVEERWVTWRFAEKDQEPKLVVRFMKVEPPEGINQPQPIAPRTEEDFKRDLETVKDALWKKDDPVQNNLAWFAEKRGLAIADADRKEVKHIRELLGSRDFLVNGIAFGADKVWLGTDRGLFAWDRKDRYWSIFAVGALFMDTPVTEISLAENTLRVTIQPPGEGAQPRRYEYEVASNKWQEIR